MEAAPTSELVEKVRRAMNTRTDDVLISVCYRDWQKTEKSRRLSTTTLTRSV